MKHSFKRLIQVLKLIIKYQRENEGILKIAKLCFTKIGFQITVTLMIFFVQELLIRLRINVGELCS